MKKSIVLTVGALGLAFALSACTGSGMMRNPSPSVPVEQPVMVEDQFRGYPEGLQEFLATAQFAPDDNVGYVFWRDGQKSIYLTTFGSGSCPLTPKAYRVDSPTRVVVIGTVVDKICTADFSPTTFRVRAFPGVSKAELVNIDLRRRMQGADQGVSELKLGTTPTFK